MPGVKPDGAAASTIRAGVLGAIQMQKDVQGGVERIDISVVPVVNQQGKVVGKVSKIDLVRLHDEGILSIPPTFLSEVLSELGKEREMMVATPEAPQVDGREHCGDEIGNEMMITRTKHVVLVDEENFPVGVVANIDLKGASVRL